MCWLQWLSGLALRWGSVERLRQAGVGVGRSNLQLDLYPDRPAGVPVYVPGGLLVQKDQMPRGNCPMTLNQ